MTLAFADILAAHERVKGHIERTPCRHSRTLSEITGAEVWVKFENQQFTAAYKERGALNKLLQLGENVRKRGVIAASAGNHSQGLAYHAARLGIPVTIVMPKATPFMKVQQTRAHGAEVVIDGDGFDEAAATADRLCAERELTYVHPFNDVDVMAGQGTVALEMLEDVPDLEMLPIPIGGGGLIAGMATAARAVNPGIRIVGVQTERFPAVWNALYGAERGAVAPGPLATIADGIGVQSPGALTLPLIREHVDEVLLVGEDDIEHAILTLLEIEKTVVEGAGAAGLAALTKHREHFAGRNVGLVLCGGNIEPLVLAEIIERGMARSGRLARLRCDVRDVPGALAELLARLGANIEQVRHQRTFTTLSVERVQIEVVVHTRGAEHVEEILEAMRGEGWRAERVG